MNRSPYTCEDVLHTERTIARKMILGLRDSLSGKEISIMSERMMENRIRKLQAVEVQIKELEEQAEALKAEIKAELEAKGVDELQTKNFCIGWKEIVSNRLDGKALRAALPEIYSQYCKASASRRFIIA